ncbi:MAG: hypothetical protein ASARMPRED_002054 [Alectoria sarmentosa]|nr:MAG: hypothetical protein ASARMPRED_002054 [Alectoria sarmentosa]
MSTDPAPDIYETPELTEDTFTHPTDTTLRSESPASSSHEDEDEVSGIVRHRLDADEARTHFLPSGERDPSLTSRISSKRKSYRSSSRKRRKDGPEINGLINGIQASSDEGVESLERKLARLRKEVAQVKDEFEQMRANKENGVTQEPQQEAESLDTLSQLLDSVGPLDIDDSAGAASRLTKRLMAATKLPRTSVDGLGSRPPQQVGASSTYTIAYAPTYQEDHTLSRVSDFDSRLTLIEAALGLDAIPLPTQDRSPSKAILPALDTLDKQLASLSTSTNTSLDKVSRRVKQLTQDAEKLEQARKAAKAAQEALSPSSEDFPSLNGRAKDADVLDDAEQRSKINGLYGTLSTIESLAPLLPSVLDRLRSLRSFHADAATASQTLAKLETRHEETKQELQVWREGLEKVENAMKQGEQTVKENTETVEGWYIKQHGFDQQLNGGYSDFCGSPGTLAADLGHIDKLPNEILHQIFQSVPPRILKLVRLSCERWASVSREHIFEQIYFASRSECIRRFEHIIRNPHVAECVKHLVFDDTQLPKRLLRQERHSAALTEDYMCRSEQAAARDAFHRRHRDQEQIRVTSRDLATLLQGLPQLTKLRKVSVIGGPSHLSWLRLSAGPRTWDLADTEVAASYWSYHKENKAYYEPWGSHRVQHLFQALSFAEIRLDELHIGNWQSYPRPLKMGLPLSSLMAPNATDQARLTANAHNVFSYLTELDLQIDLNPRLKGHDYSERHFEPLFQILSSTTRLKRLAFGVTQWRMDFNVHDTQRLMSNTWPVLVAIKLDCVRVDPDSLLNFFARHKDTLTTLLLHHVGFEPNTPHTWLEIAQRGGQLLHLDYAELDVYEWGNDSDISGWQLNSTEEELAVILGEGCKATPTTRESSDAERASGRVEPTNAATARNMPQGFSCQNSACDRCGGLVQIDTQAINRH